MDSETNRNYKKLENNVLLQIKSFLWISPGRQLVLEKSIVWKDGKHSKNASQKETRVPQPHSNRNKVSENLLKKELCGIFKKNGKLAKWLIR